MQPPHGSALMALCSSQAAATENPPEPPLHWLREGRDGREGVKPEIKEEGAWLGDGRERKQLLVPPVCISAIRAQPLPEGPSARAGLGLEVGEEKAQTITSVDRRAGKENKNQEARPARIHTLCPQLQTQLSC